MRLVLSAGADSGRALAKAVVQDSVHHTLLGSGAGVFIFTACFAQVTTPWNDGAAAIQVQRSPELAPWTHTHTCAHMRRIDQRSNFLATGATRSAFTARPVLSAGQARRRGPGAEEGPGAPRGHRDSEGLLVDVSDSLCDCGVLPTDAPKAQFSRGGCPRHAHREPGHVSFESFTVKQWLTPSEPIWYHQK